MQSNNGHLNKLGPAQATTISKVRRLKVKDGQSTIHTDVVCKLVYVNTNM
jgi:hypothetical protein